MRFGPFSPISVCAMGNVQPNSPDIAGTSDQKKLGFRAATPALNPVVGGGTRAACLDGLGGGGDGGGCSVEVCGAERWGWVCVWEGVGGV